MGLHLKYGLVYSVFFQRIYQIHLRSCNLLRRLRFAAALLLTIVGMAWVYISSSQRGMLLHAVTDGQGHLRGGIYLWEPAAEVPGLPACDHEDPTSLAPLVKRLVMQRWPRLAECHEYDQHSTPWYLERALLHSHHLLATTVESAEQVFIAVSCYYEAAWWSR